MRLVLCAIVALAIIAIRCRRCPDLTAHDEWPCPDKCDPRIDELQRRCEGGCC